MTQRLDEIIHELLGATLVCESCRETGRASIAVNGFGDRRRLALAHLLTP
jgi:hypothetical protein